MNKKTNVELQALVDKATAGDKEALETLVADATQDILLKMITHLSSFRGIAHLLHGYSVSPQTI